MKNKKNKNILPLVRLLLNKNDQLMRMRSVTLAAMLCMGGCTIPSRVAEPWTAINTLDTNKTSHHEVRPYYRQQHGAPASDRFVSTSTNSETGTSFNNSGTEHYRLSQTLSLPLDGAIDHYIPNTYRIEIDPDVDLKSVINIDISKSWIEALGQGMSDAELELITNMYHKSAKIKRTKTPLGQAIDQLLPPDYTVFAAAEIDLQTLIHFDKRQLWIEALRLGVADIDVDLTINFTQKVIELKPIIKHEDNPSSTKINH